MKEILDTLRELAELLNWQVTTLIILFMVRKHLGLVFTGIHGLLNRTTKVVVDGKTVTVEAAATIIQEQKEIVNLVIENFKDFNVDLTENRLVSYVKDEESIVAYSAIFTSNTNEKCYVQSIVNSDYSNRAKPIFNNQLFFYSCN